MADLLGALKGELTHARERLRASRLYPYYGRLTAARQRAELTRLFARLHQAPDHAEVERDTRAQLDARRRERHPLPDRLEDATVVGVGALGWERYGLWPGLERACRFRHFSDGCGIDVPFYCDTAEQQRRRGEALLELLRETEKTRPVHVVFFYADSSNLTPELLSELHRRGHWTVLMGLDDKHTFTRFRRQQLEVGVETVAPHVDVYWTTWRLGALLHHRIGARPWFAGFAADPDFFRPVETTQDIDVLFLGQSYGPRKEIIDRIASFGLDVVCRGYGWPGGFVDFAEIPALLARAKIVLGVSSIGAMPDVTIMKGRDFEVPMSGACYVTQNVVELSRFFEIGSEMELYGSPAQAAEVILSLLHDGARRRAIGEAARARSLRQHTWGTRLRELYGFLRGDDAATVAAPTSPGVAP